MVKSHSVTISGESTVEQMISITDEYQSWIFSPLALYRIISRRDDYRCNGVSDSERLIYETLL